MLPPKYNNPLLNLAVFLLVITLAVADSSPIAAFQPPPSESAAEIIINDIDLKGFPKIQLNLTVYPPLNTTLEIIQSQLELYEDGSRIEKNEDQPQLQYKSFTTIFVLDIQGRLQYKDALTTELCDVFRDVRQVSFKSTTDSSGHENREANDNPYNCNYNPEGNPHDVSYPEEEWTDKWVVCVDKRCSPFRDASVTFPNDLLDQIFPKENPPFSPTPAPSESQGPAEVSTDLDSLLLQSLRHENPFLIIIRYDLDGNDLSPYISDRVAQDIRSRQIPLVLYNITDQDTPDVINNIIESEIAGLNGRYLPSDKRNDLRAMIPLHRSISWTLSYNSQLFPDRKSHFVYLALPDSPLDSQIKEFQLFPTPYPDPPTSLNDAVIIAEKVLPVVLLIIPILILLLVKV